MLIDHAKFLSVLQMVNKTVASDDRIPIYENFCFQNSNVFSYDGICGTAARFTTGIRACVNANQFLQTISSLPGDFELTQDESLGQLYIRYKSSEIEIPTQSAAGFPDFVPKTYNEVYGGSSLLGEGLQIMLKLTSESKMPQFSGIGFHGEYAYATDGSRATRFHLNGNCNGLYTIPIRSARKLAGFGTPLRVVANKHCFVAMYQSHLFVTQLNAVNVPVTAIENQFGESSIAWKARLPDELSTVLKRCRLYSNEKSEGTQLKSMSNYIVVESQAANRGKITERIDHALNHDFDINVNASQIIEAMGLTSDIDLQDIMRGEGRYLRFNGPRFSHLVCLMARPS